MGSNLLGILFGIVAQHLLKVERQDFLGRFNEDGTRRSLRNWRIWSCHRHLGYLLIFFISFHFNFLNRFFVANSFYIPYKSTLSKLRILLQFCANIAVFKNAIMDLNTWGKKERVQSPFNYGPLVVSSAFTFVETLLHVSYLWGGDFGMFFRNPQFLMMLALPWTLIGIYWVYLKNKKGHTIEIPESVINEFEINKAV